MIHPLIIKFIVTEFFNSFYLKGMIMSKKHEVLTGEEKTSILSVYVVFFFITKTSWLTSNITFPHTE